MRLCGDLVGHAVVVRSRDSGVWLGELVDAEATAVRLSSARRAWNWSGGAGECSALAQLGPTGGKIGPPGDVIVYGVCELHPALPAAVDAWAAVPVWTGRDS